MPDYGLGKIYKICGNNNTYYGSTTDTLEERFNDHKRKYMIDSPKQCSSTLCFPNAFIELVENFVCTSKPELVAREYHYIRSNKCINIHGNCMRDEELRIHVKATKKRYELLHKKERRQYRLEHKDKIKQYDIAYRQRKKEQMMMLANDVNAT